MEIVSDRKYFHLMCTEKWQSISLSLRANVFVKPDIFNNDLNIFLFSDISNIKSNFLSSKQIKKDNVIVTTRNGKCFRINKFCPHQNANLSKADINLNNELICPAHGWLFDLKEKGIDKKSNLSINAEEIQIDIN